MEGEPLDDIPTGSPELTELGKRIEMLRIERGISKQHLARFAGTSRQQLWRVMTGKSEMSMALRARLADVLESPAIAPAMLPSLSTTAAPTSGPIPNTRTITNVPPPMPVSQVASAAHGTTPAPASPVASPPAASSRATADFARYAADAAAVERTLATMPGGVRGRALKRRYLDAIEDAAIETRTTLDADFFELRRRVLSGDL